MIPQVQSNPFLTEMIVATEAYQHARDEWNGVLNLPVQFEIVKGS